MEIEEKSKMGERFKNAAKIIQEFEEIIRTNKKDIVQLAYQRGLIFQKFMENNKLAKMITKLGVCRSKIWFKIAIVELINEYTKMKNCSLSLYFLEKHMRVTKKVCKVNASKFK